MWIIFGWQKEEKPIGGVGSIYCYDCRRRTLWVVWNESDMSAPPGESIPQL